MCKLEAQYLGCAFQLGQEISDAANRLLGNAARDQAGFVNTNQSLVV